MYIKDTTSKCTIYDKSFFNDLSKYSLSLLGDKQSNSLNITYNSNNITTVKTINFDFSNFNSMITSSKTENTLDDCWFPVFIDTDNNSVQSKEILRGSSIRKTTLGIENFLSFSPIMENWIVNNDMKMSLNWFINSNLIPNDPSYGLLLWAKHSSIKQTSLRNTLDKFPIGTRLVAESPMSYKKDGQQISISTYDILIKINNNTLKILNRDDSVFDSNTGKFIFSREQHIFDLKAYSLDNNINISNITFKLNTYDIDVSLPNYTLWIPDGECYSFIDKDDIGNMPHDVYLSAGLFHYYRQIYHRLTSKIMKSLSGLSAVSGRRLKVLSYYLATSPLIDRVSVDYLLNDGIQDIVFSYIGLPIEGSAKLEKDSLASTLIRIFKEYRVLTYNLDDKTTLSNNIIRNKIDLFKKVTTKYDTFLKYDKGGTLTYKTKLPNGPHCMINRLMKTYCDKNLNNTNVFYNEIISCGNIKIQTDIRNDRSEIFLIANNDERQILPLADIHRTQASIESNICVGPDRIIKASEHLKNGEIVYGGSAVGEELKVNLDDDLYRSTVKWELIDGPSCLRFSDLNINKAGTSRFKTSSDDSPTIYTKKIGAYKLRVTVTTEFFFGSDTITLYIVDDNNQYAPGKTPPTGPPLFDNVPCDQRQDQIAGDRLRCMCPNLRSFAIHKRGMFWPLTSDLYVEYKNTLITQDFDDLGVMRLDSFHRYPFSCSSVQEKDAELRFEFIPNNTYIALYGISLMNMRYKNDHPQCQSFYEDILVEMNPKPPSIEGIETGSSKYYRARRAPDDIGLVRTIVLPDGTKIKEDIAFTYPIVTMNYSPNVLSYGGYDQKIIDSLGIAIPNHPQSQTRIPPLNTYINMSEPNNIRCFLEDLPIKPSANLVCDKGYFHPQKGWIPSSSSMDEYIKKFSQGEGETSNPYSNFENKTSVIKFKPETHKSLLFRGAGFINLRSSSDATNNVQSSAITLTKSDTAKINHNVAYGYTNPDGSASFDSSYGDEYSYDSGGDTTQYDCDTDTNITYFVDNIENLNIEDLEVKINFLNYPNPKNLVLWLEVYNPNGISYKIREKTLRGYYLYDSSTEYSEALLALNDTNSSDTIKIYLLNQESIDHYHHNMSLLFTDSAPRNNTTFDFNKLGVPVTYQTIITTKDPETKKDVEKEITASNPFSSIKHDQRLVGSEDFKLKPTLIADGYSDIQAIPFINRLKSDFYKVNHDSFLETFSFKRFRNIPLYNTVFTLKAMIVNHTDRISSGDNLTNNGVLSGFIREKNRLVSNVDINSLCSWELIIHTDKVKHPLPVESIGLIDRKSDGSITNPTCHDGYDFIVNLKDKEHLVPQININAPYNYISNLNPCKYYDDELSNSMAWRFPIFPDWAIVYIITFTGFTGYGGGGVLGIQTGDPSAGYSALYQFFNDVRLSKRANEVNDSTRIPSYSKYPFGSSDKALVEISTDQNFWYKTEVPFFKYNNTKILENKEYNYIKLSLLNNFYEFQYQRLDDLLETMALISTDPNKTTGSFFSLYSRALITEGKKLFYLLKKYDDKVLINDYFICNISFSRLIYINNKYYTMFSVDRPVASSGTLRVTFIPPPTPTPAEGEPEPPPPTIIGNETILIYDKKHTMIDQNTPRHNQWALQQTENQNVPLTRMFNTLGEGSYGRGTDALREDAFYNITESYNDLGNIIELYDDNIYNNFNMNKNTMFYYDKETTTWTQIEFNTWDKIYGYAFSEEDASDFIWWDNKQVLGGDYIPTINRPQFRAFLESLDQEKNKEPNTRSSIFFDKNTINSMIQLRSSKFTTLPPSGTIRIQNVFEEKINKEQFESSDWMQISERIQFLKSEATNSVSVFSDPLRLSIPSLVKYIKLLPPNDPAKCYDPNEYMKYDCWRLQAKKILSAREDELRNLEYHFKEDNVSEQGVVPKIKRSIIVDNNDGGSISIQETNNDHYYWFSLSRDHKLSPAVNANPKVLKKSIYTSLPIAGDAIVGFRHITEEPGSAITNPISVLEIPPDAIAAKKAQYGFVSEWREVEQIRSIFVTQDDYLKDMLVKITDYYDIPLNYHHSAITTAEQLLSNANNIYIRFRNIPRKLKEIDSYYDVYRPNRQGIPVKQLGLFTIGETYNNFVCWRCTKDKERQQYVDPPLFYKHMNEMIFRSFYGSVDGIEHKNTNVAGSKEPWGWIPYEYF